MKKSVPVSLGTIVIMIVASIVLTQQKQNEPLPKENTAVIQQYNFGEVIKHATPTNCWTTINGSVYDVTSWVTKHPGGADAIIRLCGTDGSVAFNQQHGGDRRPATELARFKIGTLRL